MKTKHKLGMICAGVILTETSLFYTLYERSKFNTVNQLNDNFITNELFLTVYIFINFVFLIATCWLLNDFYKQYLKEQRGLENRRQEHEFQETQLRI